MARRSHHDVDDQVLEQLARSLAESSPIAPDYATVIARRDALALKPNRRAWPERARPAVLVGVAAMVALILAFVAFDWASPDQRVETGPAEGVDGSIGGANGEDDGEGGFAPLEPPASWEEYRQRADPATVQLCVSRVLGERLLADDVYAPSDNAELLRSDPTGGRPGYLRTGEQAVAMIADELTLTPSESAAMAEQARAFQDVEAGRTGGDRETDNDAVSDLFAGYVAVRSANPLMAPNPAECWLETEAARAMLSEFARNTSEGDRIACLANAQFVHAVETQLDRPNVDWRELIVATGLELRWNRGNVEAAAGLYSELQDARVVSAEDFDAAAAGIADRLHDPSTGITVPGCPLDPGR